MDPAKPHLKISGPLLSKILHEKYKTAGSCSGLLYGEIATQTVSEITDSQHTTRTESYVRIQDYMPTLTSNILQAKDIRSNHEEAWADKDYSPLSMSVGVFRIRKSPLSLSLLEKSMHRKLLKELDAKSNSQPCDFIVTLLITYETDEQRTCLTWKLAAFVLLNGYFTTVEIDISNLQGSVASSYMKGPSPVTTVKSPGASEILRSFQSSLTNTAGAIRVVDATRNTTTGLVSELESTFSSLHEIEKKLEKAMKERSALLKRLDSLNEKRKLLQGSEPSTSVAQKPLSKVIHTAERVTAWEEKYTEKMCDEFESGRPAAQHGLNNESEYVSNRRKSLEDLQKRSAVVVLQRLEVDDKEVAKKQNLQRAETGAAAINMDPFASLVLSAKEKLKNDIADLADEVRSDEIPKKMKTDYSTWSQTQEQGRSERPGNQEIG